MRKTEGVLFRINVDKVKKQRLFVCLLGNVHVGTCRQPTSSKGPTILLARGPMLGIQSNEFFKLDSTTTEYVECPVVQLSCRQSFDETYEPNVKSTFPPDNSSTSPKSDNSTHQL